MESVKEQVIDNVPKRVKELKFGIATSQDIAKQSVVEVCDRDLYDLARDRAPNEHGPLDPHLGLSSKTGHCETCGEPLQICMGHFGHVKLVLPVLHIGYLKFIIHILQVICKDCSSILLPEKERRTFLRELRQPNIDNLRKTQICKKIFKEARKVFTCPHCESLNGRVKRNGSGPMKITHEPFSHYESSKALKKEPPLAKVRFEQSFETAKKAIGDLERNMKKAFDDLNPLRILNLFEKITAPDCELLGMNPKEGRPETFIWKYLPVAPICLRPTVPQEGATTEDDITSKVSDIVHINNLIKKGLERGERIGTLMEQWDFLQAQIAMLVNSECPGVTPPGQYVVMRGFCQRLKGKQGRFRGNLSGKRVDFSGRTVISPDPNLSIDEVAIPEHVAKTMTFPERVSQYNLERMRQAVRNGSRRWPGANYLIKGSSGFKQLLKFGDHRRQADELTVGDIVERHLVDGDVVLFNRQPSLHKLSIMAHRVRVRPSRTFRLNECVCTPYNADFDGDEMNVHVPQTEEARAEALELMGVKNNLATPRSGEPIIAAIQDFITGAYLLTSKNNFYDRKSFSHMCSYMVEGNEQIDLPPPAVLKPVMLWTGKQVFNVLLRPNRASNVYINLDAPCKEYRVDTSIPRDMNLKDSWLCIRNSEIMCGVMDKNTVGPGRKDSVFFAILRDFGEVAATVAMNRLARLVARYLSCQAFSIGIGDVRPGGQLTRLKDKLIMDAYTKCDNMITQHKEEKQTKSTGPDEEQKLEGGLTDALNKVRGEAGDKCRTELSVNNAALLMANCGSKGSPINVSQMVAVVGQQMINNQRVQEGFQDRTLPHFPKNAGLPPSKGFVCNSFFTGLDPSEFIFHAMSGREGLVDTAVKTAETGYMSRRLMKSLEDLSVQYDDTIRNSSGALVQYLYGDDKLDPTNMEGRGVPVDFQHIYIHVETRTYDVKDDGLSSSNILSVCEQRLRPFKAQLARTSLTGQPLEYGVEEDEIEDDQVDASNKTGITKTQQKALKKDSIMIDQVKARTETDELAREAREGRRALIADDKESARAFARSVEKFVVNKAKERAKLEHYLEPKISELRRQHRRPFQPTVDEISVFLDQNAKLSHRTLIEFIDTCLERYERAAVQPGTAVGAIGAQSIGEPGTQMTLKTFHFAGIAQLEITKGVPRVKEIINASREISTPIITCELLDEQSDIAARGVKGRIEQTFLRDVSSWIQDNWSNRGSYLTLKIDSETIKKLQLEINIADIVRSITKTKKLQLKPLDLKIYKNFIRIDINSSRMADRGKKAKITPDSEVFTRVHFIKRMLPDIPVCGYAGASRAVISKADKKDEDKDRKLHEKKAPKREGKSDGKKDKTRGEKGVGKGGEYKGEKEEKKGTEKVNKLLVEGYGLRNCMNTQGVNAIKTKTNSIMEVRDVLGIEAARQTIIHEITEVMSGMDIDPRHIKLLADVMTYRGEVLGITRFGLSKMRDSVLQLASFEKTPDHLFEAAWHAKRDKIEGVSECIIMGQSMSQGTGAFQVVKNLGLKEGAIGQGETVFEDAWKGAS